MFLEKYTGQNIPDEKLSSIRGEIQDGPIWVSIDETTDVEGRSIGNVVIGKLCDEPSNSILNCEKIEKSNHQTIAKLFNDYKFTLAEWSKTLNKTLNIKKNFYPKLIHFTCLAHGFHRMAETIRAEYPIVDSLLANAKKIFLKASSRTTIFKELYPDLSLPPEPIITRWVTYMVGSCSILL